MSISSFFKNQSRVCNCKRAAVSQEILSFNPLSATGDQNEYVRTNKFVSPLPHIGELQTTTLRVQEDLGYRLTTSLCVREDRYRQGKA